MVSKPGAFDLRCPEAVLSAFLTNPKYRDDERLLQSGVNQVTRGNWAFAYHLPRDVAAKALSPRVPLIAKKQLRTGLWFMKHAEEHSYPILRALRHAGLLEGLIETGQLRYDPYRPFAGRSDIHGLLVRRNIMGKPLPGDEMLRQMLLSRVMTRQEADGSWGHTVAGTALVMERLLELGCAPGDVSLKRGAGYLLGQYRESLERRRPRASWSITVDHVFTSEDCRAEHRAAAEMLPHNRLTGSCFASLPLIQTGLALRVLTRLGLEDDPRVIKAYNNLLEIQYTRRNDPSQLSSGNWCAHQCRYKLEERERAKRRLQREMSVAIG